LSGILSGSFSGSLSGIFSASFSGSLSGSRGRLSASTSTLRRRSGNEGVCGGEFEKISLLDVCDSDFLVFFRKVGRGNSNGRTPSFSL